MPFKFENLEVWKLAIEFADIAHDITKKFPKDEMFSLSSQFRRAANSISLNIAEGSIGQSDPEQRKFVGYAIRSLAESVNCIHLSINKKYIAQEEFDSNYKKAEKLFTKLITFRNSLN